MGETAQVVLIDHAQDSLRALDVAARLSIPLCEHVPDTARFVMQLDDDGLSIQPNQPDAPAPLRAEFVAGKAAWRRGQGELIVKAVNIRGRASVTVLDATAGLGRDGFVLASHGFAVTLLERDPIVHALLADGIDRARAHDATREIAASISLYQADLLSWEPASDEKPDVVYLDPMFPQRRKSAKIKKEMALLQDFLREPSDERMLLERARQLANTKVVVKRPLKAEPLAGRKPSSQLRGRSTRFDVYPV